MISPIEARLVAGAAERDLVEFLAFPLDAENADVAGVMVAAGVDAAGNLDLQRADLLLPAGVGEALGDALGDRDRAGVGERAIVEAGAGDDVGDEAGIGGREAVRDELVVERLQIVLRDMRQHEVLLVADADLVERKALGDDRRRRPSARRWRRPARRRSASARS